MEKAQLVGRMTTTTAQACAALASAISQRIPSVITSKAANGYQFKTGQRK